MKIKVEISDDLIRCKTSKTCCQFIDEFSYSDCMLFKTELMIGKYSDQEYYAVKCSQYLEAIKNQNKP